MVIFKKFDYFLTVIIFYNCYLWINDKPDGINFYIDEIVTDEMFSKDVLEKVIKKYWEGEMLDTCLNSTKYFSPHNEYDSYTINYHYSTINVEVRGLNPLLIRFVDFLLPSEVENIIKTADDDEIERLQVVSDKEDNYVSDSRIAEGKWQEYDVIHYALKRLADILNLDPFVSESPLLLKYGVGGHYGAHYDYLDYPKDSEDYYFVNHGNRLATFLFMAKTANVGGGTIFPHFEIVVQPNPGDVVFWFNSDFQHEKEIDSIHGACPIFDGVKMGLSLWVRYFPQPLKCPSNRQNNDTSHDLFTLFKGYEN